ncbi:zinc-finger homeodomain protein 9-like [Syzygium oleosum]|uniref:zinc-finger homeodomain protein 9-like n=1 Tax=Syzygium oleosum TaxID=219896 RepID=UPI0011D255D5|nr:zinc-finger homeodomain protein 9-like [Syzygium oleosum]
MDMTPTNTSTNTASTKSPEPETETPTRIQPPKPLSFSNGVLKRHSPHHLCSPATAAAAAAGPVAYKKCLKNHAASLGGYALDGCGEFMPSPTANPSDPTSLKCAACGCHRNFHRREPDDPTPTASAVIEYQPHHRHHPPPPPPHHHHHPHHHHPPRSPNSASPPPISSSYYPSAPHMLLALSTGISAAPENAAAPQGPQPSSAAAMVSPSGHHPGSRKRFRTKFSQHQKERMHEFAERVGWKMQKRDEELVREFCAEVGVDRNVFKVWMHNNKNTFGKRDVNGDGNSNVNSLSLGNNTTIPTTHHNHNGLSNDNDNTNNSHHRGMSSNDDDDDNNNVVIGGFSSDNHPTSSGHYNHHHDGGAHVGTNGSSSSS